MAKKTKPVVDENLQKWEEFAAAHSAQYALIDAEGNLIGECAYDLIREPQNGFAVFKKDGKYGFLRTDGSVAVEPIYENVADFNDGIAAVRDNGRWGFINENGDVVISMEYENFSYPYFREGLAAIVKNGKYGFIDKEGKEVIAPIYENAYSFNGGMACVKINGKLGFIDTKGNLVIPAVYDNVKPDAWAQIWRDGFAVMTIANKTGVIDRKGNVILPFEYDDVNLFTTMASARQTIGDETYYDFSVKPQGEGLLNSQGIVVAPIYDKIVHFREGLAGVSKKGKCGYIDINGNIVLPLEYDSVSSFSGNYARVTKDKRTFIIDKTGREICDKLESLAFDDEPLEGYRAGVKDGKYGLLDDAGNFVVPCEYDGMERWGFLPLLKVCKDDKWGILDLNGKEVLKVEYDNIDTPREEGIPVCVTAKWREREGVADQKGNFILNPDEFKSCRVVDSVPVIVVKDQSGKCGIRRYNGSVVTSCNFDNICFESNGIARVWKNNIYGLLNSEGEWVIPAEYEGIEDISEGYIGAQKDEKWGFLNDKNEWVIAPAYERIHRNFQNGYAIVVNDGKYILINKEGKELNKPSSTVYIGEPADGLILYKVGRKFGYLNEDGGIAIKPAFEDAENFKDGCALVSIKVDKEPKWTFVTKDGVTHQTFDLRTYNLESLNMVESDGKKGLFRRNGTMAVPFVLKQVSNYIDGVSVIQFV